MAEALHVAHEHGVVHRDIKPENVLMSNDRPLVADFGIARALDAVGGDRLTRTDISLGTPKYMSPEQATGDHEVDGRSDVYSLACVLYALLAGEPPHSGPTVQAILAKQLTQAPASLQSLRASVPDHVERAVTRALQVVPADRQENAQAFSGEIRGKSHDRPQIDRRTTCPWPSTRS